MRLKGFLKPRLGKRRRSGVWPPSKPSFPEPLALWPLWPLPAVLPFPDPIPLPFLVFCFLGTLSLKSFRLKRLYARMPSKTTGTFGVNMGHWHCMKRRGWSVGLGLNDGIRIELERREQSLLLSISFFWRLKKKWMWVSGVLDCAAHFGRWVYLVLVLGSWLLCCHGQMSSLRFKELGVWRWVGNWDPIRYCFLLLGCSVCGWSISDG